MISINTIKVKNYYPTENDTISNSEYYISYYYYNLRVNTLDKYAMKTCLKNQIIIQQMWENIINDYNNIPAIMIYDNGKLAEINRYKFGKVNDKDEDNPAIITYWANGNIKTISRYQNNKAQNSKNGKPARITYFDNGNLESTAYFNGNVLEDFGEIAAYTAYNTKGYVILREHYHNGVKIDKFL